MQTLRDIMTPDPLAIEPSASLREAIEVLRGASVSGAPVVSGQRVVGVISGSDILEFDVSSSGVPTERPGMTELGGLQATGEEVEDAPGAFFVDRWFDAGSEVWTRMSETTSPEWDRMEEHQVSEVMTRRLITLPPDASVPEAARLMVEERLHRVLVMEDDSLIGIVSTFDIVKSVARESSSRA